MCSQPPKETEDSYLLRQAMELARRLPTDVEAVTLTGGEPTLYGDGLLELLRVFRDRLPATHVQLLTNGRRFSDGRFATEYSVSAGAAHIAAIPLYGAEPRRHDYVVQSEGAFDETVRGILNLARLEKRIELRVVLHKQTIPALSDIAEFISRNLPFVDRVALMGLEITGLTRPGGSLDRSYDYRGELSDALSILENASVPTLLYNHQLCLLEPATRRFAVKSISDWKNEYFPECEGCRLREECGGFFQSARIRRSAHVMAL
jgi:His-Xaa-Ser system radical SAM maturase HxsC